MLSDEESLFKYHFFGGKGLIKNLEKTYGL